MKIKYSYIIGMFLSFLGVEFLSSCEKLNIEEYHFNEGVFVYDGNEHTITLDNEILPKGYSVEYIDNTLTNAGSSLAKACFYNKRHKLVYELQSMITVNKKTIDSPILELNSFYYTGNEITLDLPTSDYYTISYSSAIEPGTYQTSISLNDKSNYCWDDHTSEDITYSYSILPNIVNRPDVNVNSEYNYNGYEIIIDNNINNEYLIENGVNKEVGEYKLTYTLIDKAHTCWDDGSIDDIVYDYKIVEKFELDIPTLNTTYNGQETNITSFENDLFSFSSTIGLNAGIYQAYVYLKDTSKYTWYDGSITPKEVSWTINQKEFDYSLIEISNMEYVYDGLPHSIYVGDVDNEIEVVVSNANNIDAGVYNVEVTFNVSNNYKPISEVLNYTYIINKAVFDVSNVELVSSEITYDGKYHLLSFNADIPVEITPVFSTDGYKDIGTYTIDATLKANNNYEVINKSFTGELTIVKGLFDLSTITFEDTTFNYDGTIKEMSYSGFVPEGIEIILDGTTKASKIGEYQCYLYAVVTNSDLFIDKEYSLEAKLIIDKGIIDLSSIIFEDTTVYYEKGIDTYKLEIEGTLPNGVHVSYPYGNTITGYQDKTVSREVSAYFTIDDLANYNVPDPITVTFKVEPKTLEVNIISSEGIQTENVLRYSTLGSIKVKTKLGYSFKQFIDENGQIIPTSNEVLEDMDIEVEFEPARYHIFLDANGGTLNPNDPNEMDLVYKQDSFILPVPIFENPNYEFIGWYDTKNNSDVFISGLWDYGVEGQEVYTLQAQYRYIGQLTEDFSIVADENYITISINSLSLEKKVNFAYLYMMDASYYYYVDLDRGLSNNVAKLDYDYLLAYKCGEKQIYKVNRYNDENEDLYYNKFYLAYENEILVGPYWIYEVNSNKDVASIVSSWNIKSKKGLYSATYNAMDECGSDYSTENLALNGIIMPNEYVVNGVEEKRDWDNDPDKDNYVQYVYNGVTYYMNPNASGLVFIKSKLEAAKLANKHFVIILLVNKTLQVGFNNPQDDLPYYLTYEGARNDPTSSFMALNTSNSKGAAYYGALMSYVVDELCNSENGYTSYFVLGNEVDYPTSWNAVNDSTYGIVSQDVYIEEYYRNLRMLSQIIKKDNNHAIPLVSYTHNWGSHGQSNSYVSYEINEKLIEKSNKQNNFEWGIASHSYAYNLTTVDVLYEDISSRHITYSVNTDVIGIANIEVYDLYLKREGYYMPHGEVRPVVLTEVGVSSGYGSVVDGSAKNEKALKIQAGTIAYLYYKIEMIDSIKGFPYFTLGESWAHYQSGLNIGLLDISGKKKYSLDLWNNINMVDTTTYVSYIQYMSYRTKDSDTRVYFTNEDTYLSVIKKVSAAMGSIDDINWDSRWESMITRLEINK